MSDLNGLVGDLRRIIDSASPSIQTGLTDLSPLLEHVVDAREDLLLQDGPTDDLEIRLRWIEESVQECASLLGGLALSLRVLEDRVYDLDLAVGATPEQKQGY